MLEPLTVASLNIQCLGRERAGFLKRREIKEFFARTTPRPDLLIIQEHKLSIHECRKRTSQLELLRGTSRWSEARCSAAKDSMGEIGILLSKKLAT